MPWCPVCGAEYREGMETCAKCRVALQASPPPPREDPARAPLVRVLRAARRPVVEALHYAGGGCRVLRRHRALLVVPLLLALFQGYEGKMFHDVVNRPRLEAMRVHLPQQRDLGEWLSGYLRSIREHPLYTLQTPTFAIPCPRLNLRGTVKVIETSRQVDACEAHRREMAGERASPPLHLGLYLLGPALSAFLLGGFFGQARRAVADDTFTWAEFVGDGRRYWFRLFLLLAGFCLLYAWRDFRRLVPALEQANAGEAYYMPTLSAIWFFLALAWCAIVVDDARFGQALRRSVVTVARAAGVGVCLLLLLSLARRLLHLPIGVGVELLRIRQQLPPWGLSHSLPAIVLGALVFALVATWFSLTALHWYRAARAKMAASP